MANLLKANEPILLLFNPMFVKKLALVSLIFALLVSCASAPDRQHDTGLAEPDAAVEERAPVASPPAKKPVAKPSSQPKREVVQAEALSLGPTRYMDGQERHLRRLLTGTGVQVRRDRNSLTVIVPEALAFTDTPLRLRESAHDILGSVVEVLKAYHATRISVEGHSDAREPQAQQTSLERAQRMSAFLLDGGVEQSRVRERALGSSMPVASNHSEYGRAHNRRVELILVPQGFRYFPQFELNLN